jgi:hypothetical protein
LSKLVRGHHILIFCVFCVGGDLASGESHYHVPSPAMVAGTAGIATTFHFERECERRSENESESGRVRVKGFIYVPVAGSSEFVLVMEKVK